MNRNLGWSTGLVALLALVFHVAAPTGSEKTSGSQSGTGENASGTGAKKNSPAVREGREKVENPVEGPWLATQYFFGSSVDVPFDKSRKLADCAKEKTCANGYAEYFGVKAGYSIEFLLATVPDPYHTRLALATDSSIQAIQQAAAVSDWEFATQWMPWNDTIDADEKDPEKLREERARIRDQEEQPGLLVFRHKVDKLDDSDEPDKVRFDQRVLLVFLVGETPTGGVNPTQFQSAREYMRALHEPAVVRIEGPTFSGSFYSLGQLVNEDKCKTGVSKYIVRSGTATSRGAGYAFKNQTHADFRGSNENSTDQFEYFEDALASLRISPSEAAVLVEDETAYGEAVRDVYKSIQVFRFPRDIAHLRNAYREAVQVSKSAEASRPDLDFSIKDTGIGEDSVPIFSKTQSPLSQNSVLNEITGAIRRERIKLVELNATNVLDLLFLARVLKRQCPDTRLMLPSADLLFIEAAQTDALTGTLALSSYPVFFKSNQWMGNVQNLSPATFRDANSEGVYNATVMLLTVALQDAQRPLTDYNWKSQPYPPIWLLTLDRGGFSPVRVWVDDPDEIKNEKWLQPVSQGRTAGPQFLQPPRMWTLLSSTAALASLAVVIWMLFLFWTPTSLLDARFLIKASGPIEDSWRVFYLFLFLLILAALQILILMPLDLAKANPGHIALALFGSVPAAGIALWTLVGHSVEIKPRLAMLIALAAATVAFRLWWQCCFSISDDTGFFFRFRANELRFGSSPSWPILAAACALLIFSFVQLTRLYLAVCQEPDVISDEIPTALRQRLEESHHEFRESLHSALGLRSGHQLAFGLAAAIFVVVCVLCRVDIHLRSIDGPHYDLLSITLQLSVIAGLLLTCWQVTVLWHALKSFAASLDTLPLAASFIPTDGSQSRRPMWVRHLNLQSLDIHMRSVLLLHDMALLPRQPGDFGPVTEDFWLQKYRALLRTLLSIDPKTRETALEERRELGRWSKRMATEMIGNILQQWSSEPLVGAIEEKQAPKQEEAEPKDGPFKIKGNPKKMGDLAQTFVALHFSAFLMYGVRQIQNLMWFLPLGFVLLMISMNSYGPQSPQAIGRFLLVLAMVIGLVVWKCLSDMERNPILSRISGTKPGELNIDFYLKIVGLGGLPVLGLLAASFPSLSNFLFSWVQPALEALH